MDEELRHDEVGGICLLYKMGVVGFESRRLGGFAGSFHGAYDLGCARVTTV